MSGSSSKTGKGSSFSNDGLPSYDEATLKSDNKSDIATLFTKESQKGAEQKKMTLEDILEIGEWSLDLKERCLGYMLIPM